MEHGHPSGALRLAFVCLRGGSVLMGWGHYYYDSLGTHCTVYNSRDGRENNLFLKHRDATGMSQASKCSQTLGLVAVALWSGRASWQCGYLAMELLTTWQPGSRRPEESGLIHRHGPVTCFLQTAFKLWIHYFTHLLVRSYNPALFHQLVLARGTKPSTHMAFERKDMSCIERPLASFSEL